MKSILFAIFPLWYHYISAIFVRNNVSYWFEIIFEFDNFNLVFLGHSSLRWKESRFNWSVFRTNWHLSRNWVSDHFGDNWTSPSLRLVSGLFRVTIINNDHSSEIQNRYCSWNGDKEEKLMFERTEISCGLVRLRQLLQWVTFTWKSVTMREGMTYPKPIPRAYPAIAKALANAISFFHGIKYYGILTYVT